MSEATSCPCCGLPRPPAAGGAGEAAGGPAAALRPLYDEVRRIRELAQAAADGERRIAALTREVNELRATVARLRGAARSHPAPPAYRAPAMARVSRTAAQNER